MIRWTISSAVLALALTACSSGPVRRVSEPTASIQQLTVRADGRWDVELRLQNYSSIPMQFDTTALELTFDNGPAARLDMKPAMEVGPESADVHSATIEPLPAGRARIASALADGRGLTYTLSGTLSATPQDKKQRSWEIKRESALSPVPGIPGALR
ncbi:MAG: hypothetical protein KUL77_00390 [Thermomonas sp.]|uniref:hypothetical protein n=1 Tax=Thermomonas sp. TaxID=1971895 RepID=UPI001EC25D47|nr:hypothetical protein [Thermomonas sp.]MBV2208007.1 hypothetical protein [Thermomonas sp.]